MKETYISQLNNLSSGDSVDICGWIASVRSGKSCVFFDMVDSTGRIQVVLHKPLSDTFDGKKEESVQVVGKIFKSDDRIEIVAERVEVIGRAELSLHPSPRSRFDVFSSSNADKVLSDRHLYIRNEKLIASLKARNLVMNAVRAWFDKERYFEVTAPILCPVILYGEDSAIKTDIDNSSGDIFLTQCVGFYLESAVHALERVYNIGPSFRAKETSSKRHLNEYWHIKSEQAFCSYEEFFFVVEDMIKYVTETVLPNSAELCAVLETEFNADGLKTPFPRITYTDALALLEKKGISIAFGKSINAAGETALSEHFGSPVWVTHNPASVEGFPYRYLESDKRLTLTADLIWSKGQGELLGIAEKITDYGELKERMKEKGKDANPAYEWFADIRRYGTVPHCGMGMGLERLIKGLFGLNHVRDVIPFPRSIGRKIYP